MNKTQYKSEKRAGRHKRIRARVIGTAARPRLAVFRSNRFVYAQLIDDSIGKTLAAADSRTIDGKTLTERATATGAAIATIAKKAGVTKVVFDRGGFKYQGIVAALADGARSGGLEF